MSNNGFFSGNPRTEWLSNPDGPDRDMKLLEDFLYTDPDGRKWLAPKGSVVNGASIPDFLWTTVGSPYTDDYRNASIVHDVACEDPAVDRYEADVMFYHACRAGGCSVKKASILYAGVRCGAWMKECREAPPIPKSAPLFLFTTTLPEALPEKPDAVSQFELIAGEIGELDEDAGLEQVDAIISQHIPFAPEE